MPYTGLSKLTLGDESGSFERTAWMLDPLGGNATSAIIFLDGELYIEQVKAPAIVRRLQEQRALPPAMAMFVSNGGAAARHADFVCSPAYASFVSTTVVNHIRHAYPAVRDFVIAGLSLSGLAAADVAVRRPDIFRAAICQSPSFWWEGGRFGEQVDPATRPGQEFWICVGSRETEAGVSHPPSGLRQELTQVEGCATVVAALRAKGYSVSYREYDGGHDPACWRDDLSIALPWVWRRT